VDRATRLVEQLLTLARVDPESDKKDFKSVNLVAVAVRVISEYAQSAVQKEIDLGLEDESSGNLDGYPEALEVLLRNLVDNAVKYTPEGGRVDVSIRQSGPSVLLMVSDTGPGIDADLSARVFDRFYRISDSQDDGCGLGLSIVKRIAELHHAENR